MSLRSWLVPLSALALAAGAVASGGPAFAASGGHIVSRTPAPAGWRVGGPVRLAHARHLVAAGGVQSVGSPNWSGYGVTGGTFTTVTASWALSAVTCRAKGSADAAPWVGIDGLGTATVEQTGTDSQCSNGTASYAAWYEMFPNAPVFLSDTVKAGDMFTGTVAFDSGTTYTLTLTDTTEGWTNKVSQSLTGTKNATAEAIVEKAAPQLANFGKDSFTSVTVDGKPIGSYTTSPFTLFRLHLVANAAGGGGGGGGDAATVCDSVSALASGTAFTATWKRACKSSGSGGIG